MNSIELPAPEMVIARIESCRQELEALKKLLRASQAAAEAENARQRRRKDLPGRHQDTRGRSR